MPCVVAASFLEFGAEFIRGAIKCDGRKNVLFGLQDVITKDQFLSRLKARCTLCDHVCCSQQLRTRKKVNILKSVL